MSVIVGYILMFLRVIVVVSCVCLTVSLFISMIKRKRPAVIATLSMLDTPVDYDIVSCENSIGRGPLSDIRLNVPTVSRRHALITYTDKDGFKITALTEKEILINDIPVDEWGYIDNGDILTIGGARMQFWVSDIEDLQNDTEPKLKKSSIKQAILLSIFQLLAFFEIALCAGSELLLSIPFAFIILLICEWVIFFIKGFKGNLQIDIIGFFLSTFGLMLCAGATPDETLKLLFCAVVGVVGFNAVGLIFKYLSVIEKLQYVAMGIAGALFICNIIFGSYINGAKNWIKIGSFSFKPSELIKFVLIFVGGTTLIHLMNTKKMMIFIGFSFFCIGSLFLMRDFGTASIYFVTMLIIIYMRQGNIIPIAAILGVAMIGIIVIVSVMPYVLNRFSAYRHVWELASSSGYQQTRTLIAIASGGMFGLGSGNGNLQYVAAADTDLVFGLLCEEWGMIIALCMVSMFVLLAIYAFRRTSCTSTAYYAIVSVAASALYLFQISLNIFGSTDILPLTGVTIPFISNGGSSMIASWLILSFIKACGRQFTPRTD